MLFTHLNSYPLYVALLLINFLQYILSYIKKMFAVFLKSIVLIFFWSRWIFFNEILIKIQLGLDKCSDMDFPQFSLTLC